MAKINKKNCDYCGKYYEGTGKKYCSKECKQKASRKSIEFNCKFCGKLTSQRKSAFKHDNPTYCSHECFYKDVRKNKVLNRAERKTIKCIHCGKEIKLIGYDVRAERKRYCSKECMNEYRKSWVAEKNPRYEPDKHIKRICKWCGKEFTIQKCHLERKDKNNGTFCSNNCAGAYVARYCQNRVSKIELEFSEHMKKNGIIHEHQYKVGSFIADFYIESKNLIIEFDGTYWHKLERIMKKDKRKESYYKKMGYNLLRIDEMDYRKFPDKTIEKIKEIISA